MNYPMKCPLMKISQRIVGFLFFLGMLFQFISLSAADLPERPVPPRLINDLAQVLDPARVAQLEARLVAFNDSTSTQIAIVTVPSLGDYDITDFADRLAEKWGVGQKGKNNGVLIVLKPKNDEGPGRVRISVGYGLEDVITDAVSKRIIESEMIPRFRNGDYTGGLEAAVDVLMKLSSGKYKAEDYLKGGEAPLVGVIVFIIIMLVVFVLLSRGRNKYDHMRGNTGSVLSTLMWLDMLGSMGHRGKWSDFSNGSGPFGGGGGFGGFGGGSFGGGGASGSW
ncbi:MAG: TPM domain-containing protein [Bacteroidales bacterium]